MRLSGSTTRVTAHAAAASGAATSAARPSDRGTTRCPVRRANPSHSTIAPTAYAADWPKPRNATVARPEVTSPPITMTAMPVTADMSATTAGMRLSPSA